MCAREHHQSKKRRIEKTEKKTASGITLARELPVLRKAPYTSSRDERPKISPLHQFPFMLSRVILLKSRNV